MVSFDAVRRSRSMSGFFVLWPSRAVGTPAVAAILVLAGLLFLPHPLSCQSWQPLERFPFVSLTGAITAMASDGERVVLIGSERGGVRTTTDAGTTWRGVSEGLPRVGETSFPRVTALEIAPNGEYWYAGVEGHGIWFRHHDGSSWRQVGGIPDTATALVFAVDQAHVLAGLFLHGVFQLPSDDGGQASLVLAPLGDSVMTVTGLCATPEGLLVGRRFDGYAVLDRTSGTLAAWNDGLPTLPVTGGKVARSGDGWYVGNALAFAQAVGGMHRRGPGEVVWTEFDTGITPTLSHAYDIKVIENTFLVSVGYLGGLGVYTWTPGEASWTAWNEGLPELTTDPMAVLRLDADAYRVFVGTRTSGTFYRDTIVRRTTIAAGAQAFAPTGGAVAVARGALLDVAVDGVQRAAWFVDNTGRTYDGVVVDDGTRCRVGTAGLSPGSYLLVSSPSFRRHVLIMP